MPPATSIDNDNEQRDDESGVFTLTEAGWNDEDKNHDQQDEAIARHETQVVRGLRLLVVLVLLTSMITVGLLVHNYISNAEQEAFESEFADSGQKVKESIGLYLDQTLGALDYFTVGVVSYARGTNQKWPLVTIGDFYLRVAKTRSLSSVLYLSICPLVPNLLREVWEEYAKTHDGWINETLELMETDPHWHGPILREWQTPHVIHNGYAEVPYNLTRDYMPGWQNGPIVPRSPPYNFDQLSVDWATASIYNALQGNTIITPAYLIPPTEGAEVIPELMELQAAVADWLSDFLKDETEDPYEPVSDIYYPILDKVNSVVLDTTTNNEQGGDNVTKADTPKAVGVVVSSWYWRDLLKNILPVGVEGILVVFENPCNEAFTYQIDGPHVDFVGSGDFHQSKYDHLKISSAMLELNAFVMGKDSYTGVQVGDIGCPFTLHVYPSDITRGKHTTNNPVIFTVVSVCIFLFTALVFAAYDGMVELRQKKVNKVAVQSSAVVSSLFPSTVRDRMFDKPQDKNKSKAFLAEQKFEAALQEQAPVPGGEGVIADLYPETTVLFMDLAGFTAWSNGRQPVDVFKLLESLYARFDAVADKRKVFKVETIGDCYMAVCGLPEPRSNHAVVMAAFAYECLEEMKVQSRELAITLGDDTRDLALRVGLHSGATTGGVLRGKKSRFQLFGDTVNTASRMESTGEKGRIHVSSATADRLRKFGKSSWLIPREGGVEAKGKGRLETFWCEPRMGAMSVLTSHTSSGVFFSDDGMDDTKSACMRTDEVAAGPVTADGVNLSPDITHVVDV